MVLHVLYKSYCILMYPVVLHVLYESYCILMYPMVLHVLYIRLYPHVSYGITCTMCRGGIVFPDFGAAHDVCLDPLVRSPGIHRVHGKQTITPRVALRGRSIILFYLFYVFETIQLLHNVSNVYYYSYSIPNIPPI